NGIVENYMDWKRFLISHGYDFASQTDTEVAAKLIDYYYKITRDPFAAIVKATGELTGAYAFGVVFREKPDTIYAARRDSPLIVAKSYDGCFIASDIPALLKYTRRYYQLEEGEIAVLSKSGVEIFDRLARPLDKELLTAQWDVEAAEKGGYAHFMRKEIDESPDAIIKTVSPRTGANGLPDLGIPELDENRFRQIERLRIIACGTAMHAGLIGKYLVEKLARVPVEVTISSEFRYMDPIISPGDIAIFISQSGETADSLAAIRLAKKLGAFTIGVVNVVGSSIAREADAVLYTYSGPEIAVASTKAYDVQIAAMYLLAMVVARAKGKLSDEEIRRLLKSLQSEATCAIWDVISREEEIKRLADDYRHAENLYYIGRGLDWAVSQEGSLKLKEISYLHCEAYAAGELKHGAISLIVPGMPVIALATDKALYPKLLTGVKEVKARGARTILICPYGSPDATAVADDVFFLPDINPLLSPFPATAFMQLFAYYVSVLRGCDVDKPRNLAKSVTVE
ncbi:MAG: glutamine--fructose-6-phosphate transaminase (isomerizing), partial [Clostridia bacterium]|nr:glutamine--fructose-6-phosphate transaminase (isomerizing) [Clostridia bacterium]